MHAYDAPAAPCQPNHHNGRRIAFLAAGAMLLAAGAVVAVVEVSNAQYVPPGIEPATQPGVFTTIDLPGSEATPGPGGMPGAMPTPPPMAISSNTPYPYPQPTAPGVAVHITLADGQTIDLRAGDVVLTFPSGGSLRATESGVLPVQTSTPTATTPQPIFHATPPMGTSTGVSPNTGGILPLDVLPQSKVEDQVSPEPGPGSSDPR